MEDRYIVTLGGQSYQLTEPEYREREDKIFAKDKNAEVARVSSAVDDDNIDDSAAYAVSLGGNTYLLTGKEYRDRKDKIRSHKDAMVSSLSRIDYWGEKLDALDNGILDAKRKRDEAKAVLNNPANFLGGDDEGLDVGSAVEVAKRDIQARNDLRDATATLKDLMTQREANPEYQRRHGGKSKMLADSEATIDKMRSDLDAANPESARINKQHIIHTAGPSMGEGALLQDTINNPAYYRDKDALNAAKLYYQDAIKAHNAPSRYDESKTGLGNFFRGVSGEAPEILSLSSLAKSLGQNAPLIKCVKAIHEHDGNNANIFELVATPGSMKYLSPAQKELVKAFCTKVAVDYDRAEDMSLGYQAGGSFAKSLGYMADFYAFGGLGDAAANWATKGITKGIAQAAISSGLKGATREAALAVPKFAVGTAKAAVKSAAMTPFMPSTYANALDQVAMPNDKGAIDLSGKAIVNAGWDAFIENMSEGAGTQVEAILGVPFKAAGKAASALGAEKYLSKTPFSAWGKAIKYSPWAKQMKQAGWNGLIGEMGEEWYGNALRTITGLDPNALKDYATMDNFIVTLSSFAPMSAFGGATSMGQYMLAERNLKDAGKALTDVLHNAGYTDDKISAILDITKTENPTQLGQMLSPVINQIARDNGNASAAAKAACDYAMAVARYRTYDGIREADGSEQRKAMLDEINTRMAATGNGQSQWTRQAVNNAGDYVGESVRTLSDNDGHEYFVVGEGQDGKLAIVDRATGEHKFMTEDETANYVDSGYMPINDFLDSEIARNDKAREKNVLEEQLAENRQRLHEAAQPNTKINEGTVENPLEATILGRDADGYLVQHTDGTVTRMSEEDMANKLGLPYRPLSDEQKAVAEADELQRRQDVAKAGNAFAGANISASLGVEGATLEMIHPGQRNEDGSILYQVDYLANGKHNVTLVDESQISGILADAEANNAAPAEETEDTGNKVEESVIEHQENSSAPILDFRGNPLPMRLNKITGEQVVDENVLWNKDPEAWVRYNDKNPNKKVNGLDRVKYNITQLDKDIAKDTKTIQSAALKGIDGDKMDEMETALQTKQVRRAMLQDILDKYTNPPIDNAAKATAAKQGEAKKAKESKDKTIFPSGFDGIKAKWDAMPKVEGMEDEIRLASGKVVKGRYVLTEAEAPTASHNPANGFAMTEGFPATGEGKTVNDRDYEHDMTAQESVIDKASNYDQRALQTPVIVSKDGVVLSGNDRTMAGQIAAANNTDKAYTDYLAKYAGKYGFTAEQVKGMEHPRVVFVPDEAMDYTPATFAMFNAEDKKAQSKTEKAVKAGKMMEAKTLASIAELVNQFEDINALYNDADGVDNLLDILVNSGFITKEQAPSMRDGNTLSGTGTDIFESALLGSALSEDAIRVAMSDRSIRKSVVSAIAQIIGTNALEDYTLGAELNDAILLLAEAKRSKEVKFGESVQNYIRQSHLFQDDVLAEATVQMLADALNDRKTSFLKKVLSLYAKDAVSAASGEQSLLTMDVPAREYILRNVLDYLGYDTEKLIIRTAETAAADEGTAGSEEGETPSVAQGDAGSESEEVSGVHDRDEVRARLEDMGAYDLEEKMTDDEVAEFLRLWEAYKPANDLTGEMYTELADDLKSTDKNVKDAAQRKIHAAEEVEIEAFKPVSEYINSLLDKYGLNEDGENTEAFEDYEEANEEGFDDLDEDMLDEPKPKKKGKKGSKKAKKEKKAESKKSVYSVPGEPTEDEIKAQTYTQEEWEAFVYGLSHFTNLVSPKTGEKLMLYYVDDERPVYHNHDCIVRRSYEGKDGKIIDSIEVHGTTDYVIKFFKANGIDILASTEGHKNEYGYWINKYGVCTNPIRIKLPSAKKGYQPQAEVAFWQYDNGKWGASGSANYAIGGGSIGLGGEYDTKSEAVRAAIDALTAFRKNHPEKHWTLTDCDNLIKNLKTRVLPHALMEEGAVNNVMRTTITADELENGVTGMLFGDDEDETTAKAEKPKKKATSTKKKESAKKNTKSEEVPSVDTNETEEEERFTLEETEGTPGNFHWISDDVCTNPIVITLPGAAKTDSVSKVSLAEKDGKWYATTFVTDDTGKGSQYGSIVPISYKSNNIPFASKADAIENAIKYIRFILDNPAKKQAAKIGETYKNTEHLVDYLLELLSAETAKKATPTPKAEAKPAYGSENKLITTEKYEELKKRLRDKLNNLNAGFDPETFYLGAQMAAYHIEAGSRSFVKFAQAMIQEVGDAVRPYLKSFYNGARDFPGMEGFKEEMTSAADVDSINVDEITISDVTETETAENAEVIAENDNEVAENANKLADNANNEDDEDAIHEGDLVTLRNRPKGFDGVLKVVGVHNGTYDLEYNPTGVMPLTRMGEPAENVIPVVRHHTEDISQPAETQPKEEAPKADTKPQVKESEPATNADTVGEIGEYTHTKTGEKMAIVRLSGDRLSKDEFKELKARAKQFGGYYSSFGSAKGFLFKTEEDAIKFNNIETEENESEQTNEQTAANTTAVVSEAASIAIEAQTLAEDEQAAEPDKVNEVIEKIDNALDAVNEQLALLGFYEADQDDSKFHEYYGYMLSAEKKATKDADNLAKKLAKDLGIEVGKKKLASSNLSQIGGEISFRLPLNEGRELYVNIHVAPDENDNLSVGNGFPGTYDNSILFRVENPSASGQERYGTNNFADKGVSYADLLMRVRSIAKDYLPEPAAEVETPIADTDDILQLAHNVAEKNRNKAKKNVSSQQDDALLGNLFDDLSNTNEPAEEEMPLGLGKPKEKITEMNGYKVGDKVIYTTPNGKTEEATIYDFENDGRPVLAGALAPVMYEVTDWENIKPLNTTDNGIQGNDGERTEGLSADNSGQSGGLSEGTGSESEEPEQSSEPADGGREEGSTGDVQGFMRTLRKRFDDSLKKNTHNNHVGKGEVVYPTTPKARYNANVSAIKLLKELEISGKPATKEQMSVLRQYTGWGGLGGFFNNEYSPEYRELRSLLDEEEFEAASLSINTAYYTPVEVIDSMWSIAEKLGFEGGKVLEGSAGIGNILASMPKSISEHSDITAVELDRITGGILKLLYPDANVLITGFQKADIPNGSVDLAITNVPFGDILVNDDKEQDISRKFGGKIHDFCIAKNVRKLREGGLGIFISTRGTLDNASKALRLWITNEGNCDFIGAFRLNNETFEGTGATSDIIVVRKRVNGVKSPNAIDLSETTITRREEYETDKTEWDKKQRMYVPVMGNATMEINSYYVEHPENMGGVMGFGFEHGDTYRPGSAALWSDPKIDQSKRLSKWVKGFNDYADEAVAEYNSVEDTAEELTEKVKEGQLITNSKGELCLSRSGKAIPIGVNSNKVKGYSKIQVLNDYNAIKKAIDEALNYQLKNESDEGLKPLLANLNKAYDTFKRKYDRLNRNSVISFLRNDVDFPAIAAVENFKEKKTIDGKVTYETSKTKIFSERVLNAKRIPTPTSVKDGVLTSVYQFGRINIPFIANALNKTEDEVKEEVLKEGLGFINPMTSGLEVEYEYLSGNVREKLAYAREHNEDGSMDRNIKALERVVPADIPPHLIEFSVGSDWIPVELYTEYAKQKFGVDENFLPNSIGGRWVLKNDNLYFFNGNNEKNRSEGVVSEKLGMTKMGTDLFMAAMNNVPAVFVKTSKLYDGTTLTERDPEATSAATAKIADLKDDFKDWAKAKMHQDEKLAERIGQIYNDTFNAIVPRTISDIFVPKHFVGMSNVLNNGKKLELRPHQARAVIRSTMEPVMLAHEVGTGKTFTLIASAMEMRRLGTAKKPMIVVQNSTLGQFVKDAKELYPNARILSIQESEHNVEGRTAFYAKVKYNDWDMIIVPQSVFEMIPDSEERRRAFIQEKIDEKIAILEQMKGDKDNYSMRKQLEKEVKDLQYEYETGEKPSKKKGDAKKVAKVKENAATRAEKQLSRRTDDVANFDEMGVDALLIDEAHEYKHLGFATAMQRGVKGVDPKYSKKSAGVYLKTRSVFDKVGWKNVVFATGTPISNTAAEIWTFMKYLMKPDVMVANHIYYFDDFVRNFGNIAQSVEFATNGKYQEVTRFSSYTNLPELVRVWSSVADTVLTKDAKTYENETLEDKVPKMENWTDNKGELHVNSARDIYIPQSPAVFDIMNAIRAKLEWYEGLSGKEKKENSSVPLDMFRLAKQAAIDARLVNKNAPDEPNSKTNKCVEEIVKALDDSKRYKGTCAVFCDMYRRWDTKGDGSHIEGFNIFDEVKRKLIEKGVPADQIFIMKSGMSTAAKDKVFAKVNNGEIRVIMGTTKLLGTGVNIQERLFFEAHIDAPNRPMDYTQRVGRIVRQGNLHKEWGIPVRVVRFGVEDTLDVTAYQRLSTKAKFINSVMNGKPLIENGMENRVLEDADDADFDNPVAVLSGSQSAVYKTAAERELRKLKNKKEQHRLDQIYIAKKLKENSSKIETYNDLIKQNESNLAKIKAKYPDSTIKEVSVDGVKAKTEESINTLIKDYIGEPLRKFMESKRKDYGFMNTTKDYAITIDNTPVTIIVLIERKQEYDEKVREFVTKMSSVVEYTCQSFGIINRRVSGGVSNIKGVIEDFKENIITGKKYETSIDFLKQSIERLDSDNELMRQREGKPFADEEKLQKQQELVDELDKKMREELAEKEKKYAEQAANAKSSFDLDGVEDLLDDEDEGDEHESVADDNAPRLDVNDEFILAEAVSRVNRLASHLGLNVHFDSLNGDAKGSYKEGTDYVTIDLAKCESIDDAIETLLHEGVAHFGLRQFLGEDGMREFISDVLTNASNSIKNEINSIAEENGWSREYAAEEYIAELAERTDYTRPERSFWRKVVEAIRSFIDRITGRINAISDDTIREMLVASYEKLEHEAMNGGETATAEEMLTDGVTHFRRRTKPAPKKTDIGYKVFYQDKEGNLFPPKVANQGGVPTETGVWLDAEAGEVVGTSKTGRQKVKAGGKGTQGGSGTLSYRPGWHLGKIPYALQFNRGEKVDNPLGIKNNKGEVIKVGKYFPSDFVWAEVEYTKDKDYQKEAESYGYTPNGKYNPALAGLPRIPVDGSYEYRTNPNPATDPWIITGSMRVKRVLTKDEVDELVRKAGREPQLREPNDAEYMAAVKSGDMEKAQRMVREAFKAKFPNTKVVDKNGEPLVVYHGTQSSDMKPDFFTFSDAQTISNGRTFGDGVYLTSSKEVAEKYAEKFTRRITPEADEKLTPRVIPAFINLENMIDVEAGEELRKRIRAEHQKIYNATGRSEDGLVIRNIQDGFTIPADTYVVKDNRNIKSAEPVVYDDKGNIVPLSERFNPKKDDIRFRFAGVEGLLSNAAVAVEGIPMGKATPEQWLKMIESKGGLKAGEDKWLGLSDWLKEQDKKTLTKQEVLDYINANKIRLEEVHYAEDIDIEEAAEKHIQRELADGKSLEELQEELDELKDSGARYDAIGENPSQDDLDIFLMDAMKETYGDDFENGYFIENGQIDYDVNPYELEADEYNKEADEDEARIINETRLDYTTPGLKNKHEIALTVPTIEPWNESDNIHFGDAGEGRAIAWARFGDAVIGLNGKALFIDEIQSNRHQEAREHGYREHSPEFDAAMKRKNELLPKYKDGTLTEEESKEYYAAWDVINKEIKDENYADKVPVAPFEKNWHELAMKRMLMFAAENGYDYMVWTTGEQQAERYNIGGVVDLILRMDDKNLHEKEFQIILNGGEGSQYLTTDEEGNVLHSIVADYQDKKLSDIVGKDLAVKMLALKEQDAITGDGLRVGGEGMKGFYDDILPRFMNKYAKKWGVQVEDKTLYDLGNGPLKVHAIRITPEMRESVLAGQLMFRDGGMYVPSPVSYSQSIGARRLAASEIARKLGVEVAFKPSSEMRFKGMPLAGRWINGRIEICLDHCRDTDDAVRTVLHEAVGHNGLRRLIGNDNMRAFCMDMYRRLPKADRVEITEAAITKYGGDFAEAVEEYLAEKAETMTFENKDMERTFWDIVLDGLRKVLSAIGINVPLTQKDIQWLMWQSYNANKQGDIFNEVTRQVVAHRLGFTLTQQAETRAAQQTARNRIAKDEFIANAARGYNKNVLNWRNRLHETWVDKDNAVHLLVEAIEKATGRAAESFEDIRLALNQMSSKGLAAFNQFCTKYYEPMQAAIDNLMKDKGCSYDDISRYVMLKHGLERNEVFAKRDARNEYQAEHDAVVKMVKDSDKLNEDEKNVLIEREDAKLKKNLDAVEAGTDVKYKEHRNDDYGGLTAMYSEYDEVTPFDERVESKEEYNARLLKARHPKFTYMDENGREKVDMAATEKAAMEEVADFEKGFEPQTEELWKRINGATKATLRHAYETNMMNSKEYKAVTGMFKYYVPLRGFKDDTAEDMYDYYNSDQRHDFSAPLMKAKGRKTEAESPFGYIMAMANSGIAADIKNEAKLTLYYFVSNRPNNNLVTMSEVWYHVVSTDEDGKKIFEPVYPKFNEDLNGEDAKKKYEEWVSQMEEEAKQGLAFKGTRKIKNLNNAVIHIDNSQKESHIIKFRVNGNDMMLYINGNPRAAQAINNELNVEMSEDYQKLFGKVLRWFAGINTSYNPEFWLSNAQRDILFAIMSTNIKEDKEYNKAFRKNLGYILRQTLTPGSHNGANKLKRRLERGELGNARLDNLYKEFYENGGVTGWTTIKNNEEWELEIRKASGEEKTMLTGLRSIFEKVQHYGEAIEQMTRFAAFVTSREAGKDIRDAINDAKELTVNFNRKGSGKAITFEEAKRLRDKDGHELSPFMRGLVVGASWLPAYGRRFIMFFNAAVQGLNAMAKLYKANKCSFSTWAGAAFALGVMQALIHALMDDDDDYLDIPDFERRTNLLIGGNGFYLKWALPQEMRAVYAFGDMAVNHIAGREPNKNIILELGEYVSDIMPLNVGGGWSAIAPSAAAPVVELIQNRDFKGAKIYKDMRHLSDEEKKHLPKYQMAFPGTGKLYVGLSQFANWVSGGDYAESGFINFNPASLEHLIEGATGGAGTAVMKFYKGTFGQLPRLAPEDATIGETPINDMADDFMVRTTPFLSRILTVTDDRYRNAHTTDLYYYYKSEAEASKARIHKYMKEGDTKKLDKEFNSKEYEWLIIYETYKSNLEYYDELIKETTNKAERKELTREQDALRKEMILEITNIK